MAAGGWRRALLALVGLLAASLAASRARRGAARCCCGGAVGLVGCSWRRRSRIGLRGWTVGLAQRRCSASSPPRQFGIGAGGALVAARRCCCCWRIGLARRGFFSGDCFVAGAVALSARCWCCSSPGRSLRILGGLPRRRRRLLPALLLERLADRADLGPGLPGRRRALRRRLEHAVPGAAHGAGTTVLGTLMALMADAHAASRCKRRCTC